MLVVSCYWKFGIFEHGEEVNLGNPILDFNLYKNKAHEELPPQSTSSVSTIATGCNYLSGWLGGEWRRGLRTSDTRIGQVSYIRPSPPLPNTTCFQKPQPLPPGLKMKPKTYMTRKADSINTGESASRSLLPWKDKGNWSAAAALLFCFCSFQNRFRLTASA